jgi:hypothetical protein
MAECARWLIPEHSIGLFRRHPVGHSDVSGHRIASPLSLVSPCQPDLFVNV